MAATDPKRTWVSILTAATTSMTDDFQRPFTAPPAIFGVAFLIGLGIDFIYPMPLLALPVQLVTGLIAVTTGILLIRSSMISIDGADTTYDPYAASTVLVTSGIYRHTRNPGYLGLAAIQFGLALMIDSLWIIMTAVIAIIVTDQFVIRLEEDKLSNTFGHEYRDYLSRARRWI